MRTTRNSTGSPLHGQSTPQATGAMYTNRAWLTHFHALTGDLEELAGGHQAVGFVDFGGEEAVWPGARNGLAHSFDDVGHQLRGLQTAHLDGFGGGQDLDTNDCSHTVDGCLLYTSDAADE
mgnify:FL=1